ncbi:hypothetical protein MTP99_002226 [Tenebrio molitor]|jgi:hypothetical protein|nr:hypothetical protein MTP99_002226 [Tenebrio molitor]
MPPPGHLSYLRQIAGGRRKRTPRPWEGGSMGATGGVVYVTTVLAMAISRIAWSIACRRRHEGGPPPPPLTVRFFIGRRVHDPVPEFRWILPPSSDDNFYATRGRRLTTRVFLLFMEGRPIVKR